MRMLRRVVLPCPLLLIAACTPVAHAPGVSADVSARGEDAFSGSGAQGRYFALGQALAREQERSAALQQQLEQRQTELESVRGHVEAPVRRESELPVPPDMAGSRGGSTVAAGADQHAGPELDGAEIAARTRALEAQAAEVASLRAALSEEQQKREQTEAQLARMKAEPDPDGAEIAARTRAQEAQAAEVASLRAALSEEQQKREQTETQLARLTAEPDPDSAARARIQEEQTAEMASLRTALAQEQHKREQTELQLARLKEETSLPAYGSPVDADLAAAKQEIADLRTALAEERVNRDRLAAQFEALQQQAAEAPASAGATSKINELNDRLRHLEAEKQQLADSFKHGLAESQQRSADLEQQLAAARTASAGDGRADGVASIRAENSALRTRLDEEHRRTEELAAKLQVATRVSDLIFKMQTQPEPAGAAHAQPTTSEPDKFHRRGPTAAELQRHQKKEPWQLDGNEPD
jgi:septal ring factor EnvC (AmiA/AmiB activator)